MLEVKRADLAEAPALLKIQQHAFQQDLHKYQDDETNPANETLDRLIYKMNTYDYYSFHYDGDLFGGAAVQRRDSNENRISPIYMAIEKQGHGFGTQIMKLLFDQYNVRTWLLETPKDNARNAHFYEKLGFVRYGEQEVNEHLTLTLYRKNMILSDITD